jgi:hypothetical protein
MRGVGCCIRLGRGWPAGLWDGIGIVCGGGTARLVLVVCEVDDAVSFRIGVSGLFSVD